MIKINTIAATALCLSTLINSSKLQAQTFECEGKKITVEGDKIANYTGTDNLTRNVSATVREDSIIYCVIRTNADGSMNKMLKYRMFIGDVALDTRSVERAIAYFNEGSRKINKLTFYAVEGKQLNLYQEMICNIKQYGWYKRENLEMSFDNEADARTFLANIQVLQAALPKGESKGAKEEATPVNFYNDFGVEGYITKSGDPFHYKLEPKGSRMFRCKVGQTYTWSLTNDGNGNKSTITEQMLKDKTINISNGKKK